MSQMIEGLRGTLGQMLPGLIAAVLILVVGWVVALVIRATLRRALGAIRLNHYLRQGTGAALDLELGIAVGAYYLVLLMMLIAFLNALHLDRTTEPLQALTGAVFAYIPKLVAAGVLLLVAWVLAMIARAVVTRALKATTIDESLAAGAGLRPFGESAGTILYWVIMLLFLPAVLGALELHGLLSPVQEMFRELLATLPNVLAAAVIGAAGWWIAKIARELVANLLAAAGADRVGEAAGLRPPTTLSRLVALVVYVAILVPTVIAALQALRLEAVSGPASRMLEQALAAVPNILAAALIVVIAWFVAGIVSRLAAALLEGMGLDRVPAAIGIGQAFEGIPGPSQLVARLIVVFIMLFAGVEAAGRLGFTQVSRLVSSLIEFGGHVVLGSVIIAVGFWLSNLAAAAILRVQGEQSRGVAGVARYAVLGLVMAMGLRAMGLADDIVNLGFGLTLGGIAVAVALSFGLGGREAAGRQMEHWLSRLRGERKP